jgi:hypothetical protein
MTLCLVGTKPTANHVFAKTDCSLTVSAAPGSGNARHESIGQKLSGTLSCGGTGLSGGTIHLDIRERSRRNYAE